MDSRSIEASYGVKTSGQSLIAVNGSPVFIDTHVPTSVAAPGGGGSGGFLFGLNLNTFDFVVHPQRNFSAGSWQKEISSDQYLVDFYFAGALVCNRPGVNYSAWVSLG